MKFTIEVEEFWLDEEELTEALQGHIKREVVRSIEKSIEEKVEQQITSKIKEVIDTKIALVIDDTLTNLIATGVIIRNRQEVTITEYVKDIFKNNSGWGSPTRQIETLAKAFGQEMKVQYNAVFANKIVSSMKEQGFLKDEVVNMLLDDKRPDGQ